MVSNLFFRAPLASFYLDLQNETNRTAEQFSDSSDLIQLTCYNRELLNVSHFIYATIKLVKLKKLSKDGLEFIPVIGQCFVNASQRSEIMFH